MPRSLWNECQRTASQLDREYPGWYNHVKLQSLNMVDCNVCVLGQLLKEKAKELMPPMVSVFMHYAKERNLSLRALGLNPLEDEDYFYKLDQYWRTLIAKRQGDKDE